MEQECSETHKETSDQVGEMMYFGNSRVTIRKSTNCNSYGVTDKTFVVEWSNGYLKDDVFLAYAKNCLDFEAWKKFAALNYSCIQNEFCSGFTAQSNQVEEIDRSCTGNISSLTADGVYIIENSFSSLSTSITLSPFCTYDGNSSFYGEGCTCPNGYDHNYRTYVDTCSKIFDIGTIGLNFTDEINPCRFLFLARQVGGGIDQAPTTVNIYYKTFVGGVEQCNVATFQVSPNPCLDAGVACWPPDSSSATIPNPNGTPPYLTPCEYCEQYGQGGGDICYFEDLAIQSSTCECPYTVDCYSQDWNPGDGFSGNCFFAPGITTTEPCVNGSWNGQTCTQGYNNVCGSTACVNKICKELDWFIKNYAGWTGDAFWYGYSSLVTYDGGVTGTSEEFFVSCGPTGVSAFNNFNYVNVTFGENSSLRQWSRIVGLLNFWTKESGNYTGVVFDGDINQKSLPMSEIGSTSCGWFYPMNLCCPPIPQGSFDYECPICGPSGFTTHSPSENSCCCAKNIIPIVFGLNDVGGYAFAATGISSIGVQPTASLKG